MAVLLTGGTGKTSRRIAALLQDEKIPFLLASRKAETESPAGMPGVNFDWLDESTWATPFQHEDLKGQSISAIYLIAPDIPDPEACMMKFVNFAVKDHGVKRFVLLGSSTVEMGPGHHVGLVWQQLVDMGLEYRVLRPTWFMDNLAGPGFASAIKGEGKIYTACGDGKIPFVSSRDIAAVATRALIDEKPHNTSDRILGPELLTYDDVAAKISRDIGREVVHVKVSGEERIKTMSEAVRAKHLVQYLSYLETESAKGTEANYGKSDVMERVTGKMPQKMDEWIEENKAAWL